MLQTIYIMWLREVKRFLRSRSRIIGSLGQPLLFLLALGYGLGGVFAKAGEGNYIEFLAPGVICMSLIFTAIFGGIQVIWDRQFGFLKETLVAPVSRTAIMLGRTLGGATVATLQGCIVLLITLFVGFHPYSWVLVIPAILVMFLVSTLFAAIGMMIGSLLTDMQGFQLIMNFLVMPLFFLSGALFPLSGLPVVMVYITRADPLSYGVDAMRGLLIMASQYNVVLDVGVLFLITALFLALGSYFFSRIEV
jgi:ABC-2 type transport system permease protein